MSVPISDNVSGFDGADLILRNSKPPEEDKWTSYLVVTLQRFQVSFAQSFSPRIRRKGRAHREQVDVLVETSIERVLVYFCTRTLARVVPKNKEELAIATIYATDEFATANHRLATNLGRATMIIDQIRVQEAAVWAEKMGTKKQEHLSTLMIANKT